MMDHMGDRSAIQWTEATWNPTTGCDRTSPGCDNCYALTLAARLKRMGQPKYQLDGDPSTSGPGFKISMHEDALEIPLRWRAGRHIFVNSMSDLFHPEVTDDFIGRVLEVARKSPRHTYQVLTKRSKRLSTIADNLDWPPNVWMGVSVESDRYTFRARHLASVPAAVRFLSCEPLIGPLQSLDLQGIDWVIVGGESGPGARPIDLDWVRDIRDQCDDAGIHLFVKQLGTAWSIDNGHGRSHGGEIESWPADLRVRRLPDDELKVASA
jgi:protein gp37